MNPRVYKTEFRVRTLVVLLRSVNLKSILGTTLEKLEYFWRRMTKTMGSDEKISHDYCSIAKEKHNQVIVSLGQAD